MEGLAFSSARHLPPLVSDKELLVVLLGGIALLMFVMGIVLVVT
jgi:hypothetical protein